jgi:dipeptidyl aminopeptidase/acylaminoacyl peptidase
MVTGIVTLAEVARPHASERWPNRQAASAGDENRLGAEPDGGPRHLHIVPDGTGRTHEEPAWSPHGSKILFTSPRSGSWQLCTMGPPGGNLSQLTATDHTGPGVWSPDGAYIAFTRRPEAGNHFSVWIRTAPGADETLVSSGGNNDGPTWKGMR